MRRFVLRRMEDETGVSGTGDVAEGVVFGDGTTVLHWRTTPTSTGIYSSVANLEDLHGHGGRTLVVFLDPPPVRPPPALKCAQCGGAGVVSIGGGVRGIRPCPRCRPAGARP